ncbi:sigma-70 family RNA polymerase sigma factor [Vampirovibrio sp.]|uniref:sigma-70 family RNA polymerase sigma factor n=1 Tax=Vampirovibrio sp. TaxID=2717857 RepID=UPI0035930087
MAARQALMTSKSSSSDSPQKPRKTVNDYVDLIETVARVEFSRLPNHLIDFSEVVNIGAIAIHVMLTSNPEREFNVTYLSTAIKWAIRNELRYRYKWYSLKHVSMESNQEASSGEAGADDEVSAGFEAEKGKAREAVYGAILSVDSMMESDNPHEIKDNAYTPEENSELKEMAKVVRDAISKLPEREKQIIEARFFKNMKMREIGETFNISPSRTSRIVQAGLDKIKLELQRRGYNPNF